jgi:hypothetical protein
MPSCTRILEVAVQTCPWLYLHGISSSQDLGHGLLHDTDMRPLHCLIKIRVVEDDKGRLSARL